MKLKILQEQIISKTIASDRSRKKFAQDIAKLRRQLIGRCDHSLVRDYTWEHDNGYGRQSAAVGEECVYCLATKPWKGSALWDI